MGGTVNEDRAPDAFEQGELSAYMEAVHADGMDAITDAERLEYYRGRYDKIKATYRSLLLQKEEADGRKDEEALTALAPHFRRNFVARRHVVSELRKLAETVSDPYVPTSATSKR
jgi:hypothetical protein